MCIYCRLLQVWVEQIETRSGARILRRLFHPLGPPGINHLSSPGAAAEEKGGGFELICELLCHLHGLVNGPAQHAFQRIQNGLAPGEKVLEVSVINIECNVDLVAQQRVEKVPVHEVVELAADFIAAIEGACGLQNVTHVGRFGKQHRVRDANFDRVCRRVLRLDLIVRSGVCAQEVEISLFAPVAVEETGRPDTSDVTDADHRGSRLVKRDPGVHLVFELVHYPVHVPDECIHRLGVLPALQRGVESGVRHHVDGAGRAHGQRHRRWGQHPQRKGQVVQRDDWLEAARDDRIEDLPVVVKCGPVEPPRPWLNPAPLDGEPVRVHAQRDHPVEVLAERDRVAMRHPVACRPKMNIEVDGRAKEINAFTDTLIGCEQVPVVVLDPAFHLVRGRRAAPEKIRRELGRR